MKILKMKLENFQGIKQFELCADGKNCAVYGDNGTGKSTLYNAFTWLMYGNASTGEKNYSPKTAGTHNLHHSVELLAMLDDGSEILLKKDFHEVYKTVRGSAKEVFSGHTTEYSVDGVPVNETGFKKVLLGIYQDEETAMVLTSHSHFLESMKMADRRKILLQVCGDAGFWDVIKSKEGLLSQLPKMLRKPGNTESYYAVEEYLAIAAKEKKLINKELDAIPQRIDEAEKAKPDIDGMNEEDIDAAVADIRKKRCDLESRRAVSDMEAELTLRQQIAELEARREDGNAAYVREEALKNKDAFERIRGLREMKSDTEMSILHLERQKQEQENKVRIMESRRKQLIEEWNEESKKEWNGREICPTCGRPLPEKEVEKAKETFYMTRARRLEMINQTGMAECSVDMINAGMDEAGKINMEIDMMRSSLERIEGDIKAAEKSLAPSMDYKDTDEYAEISQKINGLKEKLSDARAAAEEADQVIRARLTELDGLLESEQTKKALLAMAREQDARIAQLKKKETELAARYDEIQKGIYLCEQFIKAKTALLDDKINSRFQSLRFRLFIEQQNGGIADDCEALIPCEGGRMVPFKSANNAARINAGLEVIDTLASHYGLQLPVFVDNAESVTSLKKTDTQVIRLVVSEHDKTLRMEKEE